MLCSQCVTCGCFTSLLLFSFRISKVCGFLTASLFPGEGIGEIGFPGHRAIKEQEGLMALLFSSRGFLQNLCSPRLEEACGYGTCESHDYKIGSRDKVETGGVVVSGSPEVSGGHDGDTLLPCVALRLREEGLWEIQ